MEALDAGSWSVADFRTGRGNVGCRATTGTRSSRVTTAASDLHGLSTLSLICPKSARADERRTHAPLVQLKPCVK